MPSHSQSRLIESRVIPASGPVIIRSSPIIVLTSVDLPAFGRPTIASLSGASPALLVLLFEMLVLDVRPERFEQVGDAFAMLGAERDRVAKAEAVTPRRCRSRRRGPRPCWQRRSPACVSARSQRPISSSSGVSALARIDQEQRGVGVAHGGLGLLAHPPGKRVRILVLEPRGVDHAELEPEQLGVALAPVASDARAGRRPAPGACRRGG